MIGRSVRGLYQRRKWNYVRNCYLIGIPILTKNTHFFDGIRLLVSISWFSLCFSQSLWAMCQVRARAHVSLLFICVSKSPNFRFLYVTTIFEVYGHLFHSTIYRLTQSLVIVSDSHITFLLLIILSFFSFNAFSVFIERFFPFEIRRRRKKIVT